MHWLQSVAVVCDLMTPGSDSVLYYQLREGGDPVGSSTWRKAYLILTTPLYSLFIGKGNTLFEEECITSPTAAVTQAGKSITQSKAKDKEAL